MKGLKEIKNEQGILKRSFICSVIGHCKEILYMLCNWTIFSFQKVHLRQSKSGCPSVFWTVFSSRRWPLLNPTQYKLKMEMFVMQIFLPLLIFALMTSTVVTKRLPIENKGKKHVSFLYSTWTPSDLLWISFRYILFKHVLVSRALSAFRFASWNKRKKWNCLTDTEVEFWPIYSDGSYNPEECQISFCPAFDSYSVMWSETWLRKLKEATNTVTCR